MEGVEGRRKRISVLPLTPMVGQWLGEFGSFRSKGIYFINIGWLMSSSSYNFFELGSCDCCLIKKRGGLDTSIEGIG